MSSVDQSGTFALGDLHVRRLGFGAMHLVIVTKVGARRGKDGPVLEASSPNELISAVHDNLHRSPLHGCFDVHQTFSL